jgi:ribonucleoside-diphosphate reductase alpha chain
MLVCVVKRTNTQTEQVLEKGKMPDKAKKYSSQQIASEILRRRYLWKDADGRVVETVDQMYQRVAQHVATAESKYGASEAQVKEWADKFYCLLTSSKFLPNSPTLMNARRKQGMLSACFVIPVEDSIETIFEAIKQTALIQKAGGGTGFSFDKLRPTGDLVRSSGGKTSGPISFWRVFAQTIEAIQQGAFRRGANMGMMSIEHPDILKFINAKQDITTLTNFNISVKVTDAFMKMLVERPAAPHTVVNPRTKKKYAIPHSVSPLTYSIGDLVPQPQNTDGYYTVQEIWDLIVRNAWATGEPGICFIDRVNEANPTPHLGHIEASNPCGEQPLLPYESCNLGSVNISKFICQDRNDLDWEGLADTVRLAVRFLDNVIDVNHYPVPEIERMTSGNRKIGLGIMGFADTLVLLGIRYDSKEAVEFAERIASFVQGHAHQSSGNLAKERGCFPNWRGSIWETKYHRPMRNATVTTIAPTGTISAIAGCTGGIEPIFSIVSKRRVLDGEEFLQLHPLIESIGREQGWLTDRVRSQLFAGVPPREISQIPSKLASVLVTAHEVSIEWHVRIQAAFQKYTDNAVSKTVNLPSDATVDDVDKVYRLAYESGSKGITVYRDSSRENQVLTAAGRAAQPTLHISTPRPRPKRTSGSTIKKRTGCGSLYVTINRDEKGLFEIFTNLGKAGGCPSQSEATARIVSVALRSGVAPEILVEQLRGIRCLSTVARKKENGDIDVLSCPDAIARALEETLRENFEHAKISPANRCPDCR